MCNKWSDPSIGIPWQIIPYVSAIKGDDYIAVTGTEEGMTIENYTEAGMRELETSGVSVLEKIDIRGQDLEERYIVATQRLKKYIRNPNNGLYTREEKISLAREFVETIRSVPYVNSAFIIGSIARGDDELGSDIDVLVLTSNCPGSGQCTILPHIQSYKEPPLDIVCYTTEEFKNLKRESPYARITSRAMTSLFER